MIAFRMRLRTKQPRRRLIAPPFAEAAARLLAPGGELRLKTDFPPHLDALIGALAGLPLQVCGRSDYVRGDGAPGPDEVTTNYQQKFNDRSVPVRSLWVRRTEEAPGCSSS